MFELPQKTWTLSVDKILNLLEVSLEEGLSDNEIKARAQRFGPNTLQASKGRSGWMVLADPFRNEITTNPYV